jgi:hypothetical protein
MIPFRDFGLVLKLNNLCEKQAEVEVNFSSPTRKSGGMGYPNQASVIPASEFRSFLKLNNLCEKQSEVEVNSSSPTRNPGGMGYPEASVPIEIPF